MRPRFASLLKVAGDRTLLTRDRKLVIARFAWHTRNLPGDTAEFGVFEGGISKMIASVNLSRTHHCYDTFQGLPADDTMGIHRKGEFNTNLGQVKKFCNLPNILFHVGIFPDTAVDTRYAFVHLDCDTYQSMKAGLQFFMPRMVPGGVIVLDDLDSPRCRGVRQACNEMNVRPDKLAHMQGVIRKRG